MDGEAAEAEGERVMQRQLDDAAEGLGCLIIALLVMGALAVLAAGVLIVMRFVG